MACKDQSSSCLNGVQKVSSVSVNLILTVRKAVSLGISVWFYGAGFNPGLIAGAAMVLTGSVLYSMAPGPAKEIKSKDEQAIELDDVSTPSAGQTSSVRPLSRTEDLTRRKPTATVEEIED
jgi:UDP-xylose/UDP-N-acetylglucosamine transporter B4